MSTSSDLILNLSHIGGLGMGDIMQSSADPLNKPGTLFRCVDAFGPRTLQYCQNQTGSTLVKGALASYGQGTTVGGAQTTITVVTGTTTSITSFTGPTLVVNNNQGFIAWVLDNADSAGAAPEDEASIISSNTLTVVNFEPDYPFSAALAVSDTVQTFPVYSICASADGNLSNVVAGVVLATAGIADNAFGWVQRQGKCVALWKASTAAVAGAPAVADAGRLNDFGSDGQELWVGTSLFVTTSDSVSDTALVEMSLFTAAGIGTAP